MIKLNLGCGENLLPGWNNYDSEVDISKRLGWHDDSVDFVFAEHVVEHVTYIQALGFFSECHRILKPGGVCRIAVPSVERVWKRATPAYGEFVKRWVDKTGDLDFQRRAMTNILFMHGHLAPWTEGLLEASLFYAGFTSTEVCRPRTSRHQELCEVEGHHKVIGIEFNEIETVVVEATK